MHSPVSLCTGVTYDRSSIQRWLDSGNTTCPATMQPLASTELVPNLVLRNLISVWSRSDDHDLLKQVESCEDPVPVLAKIRRLFSDDRNRVVDDNIISFVVSFMKNGDEMTEMAIAVLSVIHKQRVVSALLADLDGYVCTILRMLRKKTISSESRNAAVTFLDTVLSAVPSDTVTSVIVDEIIRLVDDDVDSGISCLMSLSKETIVQAGTVVPVLVRVLNRDPPAVPEVLEKAMLMLYDAVGSAKVEAEECVEVALRRMMKVGIRGREAAVGVIWTVCFGMDGRMDRRAGREVVVNASGAMAKILVVMQEDCSPRVARMAGDLLRLFRGCGKGRIAAGYDTRTIHIMPF